MGTAGRIAAGVTALVVLLLVIAQVVLPKVAADRISQQIGRYGSVESVSVSAWPAVKLLWKHADTVKVRIRSIDVGLTESAKLVWESQAAARMDVSVGSVREAGIQLSEAALHKRGDRLFAEAQMSGEDVRAALPPGFDVTLVSSEAGRVVVRASGGLFGLGASVQAAAEGSEGRLVAHPLGIFGGLRLTFFSDPHIYIEGVGASLLSQSPLRYRITLTGRLR